MNTRVDKVLHQISDSKYGSNWPHIVFKLYETGKPVPGSDQPLIGELVFKDANVPLTFTEVSRIIDELTDVQSTYIKGIRIGTIQK